jgi:hypothetical protein
MKKSIWLTNVPPGAETAIRPDPVPAGTEVVKLVLVDAVTIDDPRLKRTLLFGAMGSKLVPTIVTPVPATPIDGETLLTVGIPALLPTVKG